MTPHDIAVLVRIKQAREQCAEAALRQAHSAQLRAVKARGRAELAAAEFAEERPAQEAAVYRALVAGPIPGQRLREAAVQLSGIVAYAEMLGQRTAQAAQHETACAETSAAARRAHATAVRDSLGAATMQQRLDAAMRSATERSHDTDMEESAALRDPAPPGCARS
jgi:Type III secretion protein YscO